jgi:hypothetical protein
MYGIVEVTHACTISSFRAVEGTKVKVAEARGVGLGVSVAVGVRVSVGVTVAVGVRVSVGSAAGVLVTTRTGVF